MTLTSKQYVESSGVKCPNCEDTDLSSDDMDFGGSEVIVNIVCENCGAYWVDVYSLVGYDNLERQGEQT